MAAAWVLALWAGAARAQVAGYQIPGEQTAAFAAPALARSGLFARDADLGVLQRSRPEYEPAPIALGGFNLEPSLTGTVRYSDNIFARPSPVSDAIFVVQPSFLLESTSPRNYISLFGNVSSASFLDHSSESTVDYVVGSDNRFDLASDLGIGAGGSYERDTEPRTAPGSPVNAAEPVRFNVAKAYVGAVKQFNRIRLSATAGVRDVAYDDVPAIGGGVILQRDLSRTETSLETKAEYAFSPAATVFVEAIGDHRASRNQAAGAPSRTSSGYDVTVGSDFQVTRLVRGQAQVGYLSQNYDDARFKTVSGVSVRGFVQYFPLSVLTFGLYGSRAVQDAEIPGSPGYFESIARLQADYEVLRQLVLSAQVQFENDAFRGVDRNDDRTSVSLDAQYLINRTVGVIVGYSHIEQQSSGALRGVDYDVNRFSTSLSYRF